MKRILSFLFAGALAAVSLTSCEKEKAPIDVTKNAFLVNRAWKLKSISFTSNVDAEFPIWEDRFTDMEPCKKDDYFYFSTKSTGIKNDYFVKCNITDPDFIDVFYSVSENDTYLLVYSNPDDIGASAFIAGKMETPNINEFKIINKSWNETTELNEQIEYVYEETFPTDI